tara:strand:+ start:1551 stop:2081 length:531 start_codon:yes stop_codon:yes gene_type:complete
MIESITPSTAAISLADMKEHARIDGTLDDTYVETLILAGQRIVESEIRRTLSSAVWQQTESTRMIALEYGDLVSVDAVFVVAKDGTETAVSTSKYHLPAAEGARYVEIDSSVDGEQFRVRYTTTINDEAKPIAVQAVKMLCSHWFEHREEVVVGVTPARMPLGYQHIVGHLSLARY